MYQSLHSYNNGMFLQDQMLNDISSFIYYLAISTNSLFPLYKLSPLVRMGEQVLSIKSLVHAQSLQLSLDLCVWDGGRFRLCRGSSGKTFSCCGGSYHLQKTQLQPFMKAVNLNISQLT